MYVYIQSQKFLTSLSFDRDRDRDGLARKRSTKILSLPSLPLPIDQSEAAWIYIRKLLNTDSGGDYVEGVQCEVVGFDPHSSLLTPGYCLRGWQGVGRKKK